MRAIQITEFGGPEVLELVDLPDPEPAEGFHLVDVTAAGVNYADTHQVENTYLSESQLPMVPGSEVVGTTQEGRRIASLVGTGGYAEKALAFPDLSFDLPEGVSDAQALALMVQGLSAWHLLRTSSHLAPGETVVVHAAAGGVGTLAIQLAKVWGAGRIIGVASSPDKRELAASLGADATVDAGAEDLKSAMLEANGGAPVDIVLEMVGGPTFDASLGALAPFGRLVTFGMAGRTPPSPIDAGSLLQRSRGVIGFWLVHCLGKPAMVKEPMAEMLSMVAAGTLTPIVGATYPLADARKAHEDLRSRRSTGKLVLDPRS
ncbi:MAG TPA: NADPH:quinone oxidoreductase family protein [Mycobacteriales bacterium]|nr:NADPH:quinone oxidoreductase family protein [Mycobacteriales bacterium]